MKKYLFGGVLAVLFYSHSFSQTISTATVSATSYWDKMRQEAAKFDSARRVKAIAFWTAMEIFDTWIPMGEDNKGYKWFVLKTPESIIAPYVKTGLMIYMPQGVKKDKTYEDMVWSENVVFDCAKKNYEILGIEYRYGFTDLLDILEVEKPRFIDIVPNSIVDKILEVVNHQKGNK
jgi:hypothetical protein